ncbi:MAG: hypothetical protein JXM71_08260 [Spirochaetales bacterium]|nr:hypothetical protein [Spirochaetales bacterium]
MKRLLFTIAAAILLGSVAVAQGAPLGDDTFVGRIDLNIGISQLAGMAASGDESALTRIFDGDTALLLFGTLSRPIITSDAPYEALCEFLEGEWVGSSKVVLHRVYLGFQGEVYRDFLDGASGRRTVVIARNARMGVSPDGSRDIYLDVVSVRPIY